MTLRVPAHSGSWLLSGTFIERYYKEMDKLSYLKQILNNSTHTVALCGSGMLKECGLSSLKSPNYSYEIEEKYGVSPEYIYTSSKTFVE